MNYPSLIPTYSEHGFPSTVTAAAESVLSRLWSAPSGRIFDIRHLDRPTWLVDALQIIHGSERKGTHSEAFVASTSARLDSDDLYQKWIASWTLIALGKFRSCLFDASGRQQQTPISFPGEYGYVPTTALKFIQEYWDLIQTIKSRREIFAIVDVIPFAAPATGETCIAVYVDTPSENCMAAVIDISCLAGLPIMLALGPPPSTPQAQAQDDDASRGNSRLSSTSSSLSASCGLAMTGKETLAGSLLKGSDVPEEPAGRVYQSRLRCAAKDAQANCPPPSCIVSAQVSPVRADTFFQGRQFVVSNRLALSSNPGISLQNVWFKFSLDVDDAVTRDFHSITDLFGDNRDRDWTEAISTKRNDGTSASADVNASLGPVSVGGVPVYMPSMAAKLGVSASGSREESNTRTSTEKGLRKVRCLDRGRQLLESQLAELEAVPEAVGQDGQWFPAAGFVWNTDVKLHVEDTVAAEAAATARYTVAAQVQMWYLPSDPRHRMGFTLVNRLIISDLLHYQGGSLACLECKYKFPEFGTDALPGIEWPTRTPLQDLAFEHLLLAVKGNHRSPVIHIGVADRTHSMMHDWSKADLLHG